MKYLLLRPDGTIMTFNVKALAEIYKTNHGGVLIPSVPTSNPLIPAMVQ